MDQASKLEPFLLLAKNARGKAAAELVKRVTEEPGIYGFGELLDLPAIKEDDKLQNQIIIAIIIISQLADHMYYELRGTDQQPAIQLLELFCYGTWTDYKSLQPQPPINSQQQLKLKQLTVVSLAAQTKEILYAELLNHLEIQNIRELEDLLISECFYPGLLKGKLDQKQRCLHVHEVIARDVQPTDVPLVVQGLGNWLKASQDLLTYLQGSMASVQAAAEAAKSKQAEMEAHIEAERKKHKAVDKEGEMMMEETGTLDMMDVEDRSFTPGPHHTAGRSKRRR